MAGWLSWLEHPLIHQRKFAGVRVGTGRQPIDVSPPYPTLLSLPLPPFSLSKINKYILR